MKPDFIIRTLTLGLLLAVSPLPALAADDTNSVSSTDYSSFRIISDRNIFNPNRSSGRRYESSGPRVRVDSFTLIGTMSYEKGSFAIFEGTSSAYRKTFKTADTIAGYRIAEIDPYSIKLLAASNQVITLPIGAQMKRTDRGPWTLLAQAEPMTASAPTPSNPGEPPSFSNRAASMNGADSEILKRLMMKRQKEQ